MKFQDQEELTSAELGDALAAMREQGRYKELLMIAETCQAESLHSQLRSPGLLSIASSKIGAISLSHLTCVTQCIRHDVAFNAWPSPVMLYDLMHNVRGEIMYSQRNP